MSEPTQGDPGVLPPTYADVIRRARRALVTGVDIREALEEVLQWAGDAPSPVEGARIELMAGGLEPRDFAVVPVTLILDPGVPGHIVTAKQPDGTVTDLVVMLFQLQVPLTTLRGSKVLQADGSVANPVEGMIPAVEGRWVIPRARLRTPEAAEVPWQIEVPEASA